MDTRACTLFLILMPIVESTFWDETSSIRSRGPPLEICSPTNLSTWSCQQYTIVEEFCVTNYAVVILERVLVETTPWTTECDVHIIMTPTFPPDWLITPTSLYNDFAYHGHMVPCQDHQVESPQSVLHCHPVHDMLVSLESYIQDCYLHGSDTLLTTNSTTITPTCPLVFLI